MKTYSQKTQNFFPAQIVWLGWVFAACSILIMFSNVVVGSLFAILSLLVITGVEGLIINLEKKKLKYYWGVFGLRFGHWETIPSFSKVTISAKIFLKNNQKISSTKQFEVKLWFREFNDYTLAYSGKLQNCQQKGTILAKMLKLPLINLSKTNGKAHK